MNIITSLSLRVAWAALWGAGAVFASEPNVLSEPALQSEQAIELHGTFRAQPFWAKLLPKDPALGNQRVLQLVYDPPTPTLSAGALHSDCPFILIDSAARIVAWDGREKLTQVVPAATGKGYRVTRELDTPSNEAPRSDAREVPGPRAWDVQLAPVQLALCWRADSSAVVRAIDFFGPRVKEKLSVTWTGAQLDLAGNRCRIVADADGRMHQVMDQAGVPLITIDAYIVTVASGPTATP